MTGVGARRTLAALLALAGLALGAGAQPAPDAKPAKPNVRELYTKYEHRVAMRDGTRLFTSLYVPKTCDAPHPILLNRTPYSVGPYGVDQYRESLGPSEPFARAGFVVVYQDVRGRYMSEGTWTEVRPHVATRASPQDTDESTDTWDTIDWLVEHVPCNNGRVGMWGISYPGFYVSAGMIDAHPALKAVSPQAPVTDYYLGDDSFHNGAFMLAANFGFYTFFKPRPDEPRPPQDSLRFDYGTPSGYEFFLAMGPLWSGAEKHGLLDNVYYRNNLEHTSYDLFWRARSIWRHFRNLPPAVLAVGGWFDAEDLMGPLRTYRTIRAQSPAVANHLVMGPWTHGSWSRSEGNRVGNLDFGQPTAVWYREQVEWPFFKAHLVDAKPAPVAKATMFETGTNRWRQFDAWPPAAAEARSFYLREGGRLSPEAPGPAEAFDEYVSDPSRPVPYVGHVQIGMQGDYMTEDQRFAATRPDVLVYQTEVLDEDLTVLGPIGVTLHVSTSGTDSDFVVKVIDVYPGDLPTPEWKGKDEPRPANYVRLGGYQQLVRGEPFRGKFRRSFEQPEPFTPGQPDLIRFDLPDVAHTFRRGHRLMVQVQSSWFPLVDRNPQTFGDIPRAKPEDFRPATQRVFRSAARPSSITVTVEPQPWR
ncbi:MAG: CocE/NonD family hydrolase [Vicinamibacteria bacterium]|nr:CocE/NonD family hydrolase [Vicinamibacteria bacterium]